MPRVEAAFVLAAGALFLMADFFGAGALAATLLVAGFFTAGFFGAAGRVAVDVGASTGGFTDCLLQRGAARVYAIDVGSGQLHWRLRNDPRVVVREGVNARALEVSWFDPRPDLAVVDVSFISLELILPPLVEALARPAELVTLIKPQFEAGREQVGKNGVVRDPAVHAEVVERIKRFGEERCGLVCCGVCTSKLKGPAGNVEFLAWWKTGGG